MRAGWLWLAAVLAGCSFETGGHPADDDIDAAVGGPDATVVDCTSDTQCQTPPSPCKLAGLCNPATQQCEFPDKDCSGAGDECNVGTCQEATGECIPSPAFDGDDCGAGTTCDSFGACGGFDPGDVCDETGTRSRDCTDRVCSSGSCIEVERVDSEPCTRDQDGVTCDDTTCGDFGACGGFSDTCDEHGLRARTCTAFACDSGSCAGDDFTDFDFCTRGSRDGITCASDDCGPFGACQFSPTNVCDETGSRSRVCTTFECQSEVCEDASSYVDSETCTRDTDGHKCDEVCTGMGGGMCTDLFCMDGSCPTP